MELACSLYSLDQKNKKNAPSALIILHGKEEREAEPEPARGGATTTGQGTGEGADASRHSNAA